MRVTPGPHYAAALDQLADDLAWRCDAPFNLVVIDGVPASGKSTLSHGLKERLAARGRPVAVIENDWFIARSIRSPAAIALGLLTALSPIGVDRVERKLLGRFLDGERLSRLQRDLRAAREALQAGQQASIRPEGAFWNLRYPPSWTSNEAASGLDLSPGSFVIVEGTLTRATWLPHFPELTSVLIHVPSAIARRRFLERNKRHDTMRNRAFTALAHNGLAFRLAADMLNRNRARYDFEVDLSALDRPVIARAPRRA